ncbi:hypothetical protein [Bradyrhizobium neotropicale]|uniref:hypothetical protein n=1 Tax=Bradyrhizobium neotropicale TaxID=1497615 RepID=UPI001AD6D113|nr:hypothetical protein [Bradyrhizobium neotropicale]MBO4228353.1 hypothetical protein [Bradyrhizobium neotropicale]
MGTKRERLFGAAQIMGAAIRAKHAREEATKAAKAADGLPHLSTENANLFNASCAWDLHSLMSRP